MSEIAVVMDRDDLKAFLNACWLGALYVKENRGDNGAVFGRVSAVEGEAVIEFASKQLRKEYPHYLTKPAI